MPEALNKLVRELDQKLLARYRFDTDLFDRLRAIQTRTGILHDDRPICTFLRPHFLARSRYDSIAIAANGLHAAFERMTEAALADPALMAEVNLTEKEERAARIDPRYSGLCVSSRFDTFLSGDEFKFLEYNAETPAGVGDQIPLAEVFAEIPEVCEFLDSNPHFQPRPFETLLTSIVTAYRETGGTKPKPNIAIVDWDGVSTAAEFEILREFWEAAGHSVLITNPYDFEYDGKRLWKGDFEVDIFYKRVIIHEFLETFDETHPLIRAYGDGNVCMANNFRVKIPHKKTSFAILTDEKYADLFTPHQQELIRRHIPWTRRIRESRTTFQGETIDLLPLLRSKREDFLLKPHDDYGGHGISFGWESTESEWDELLENALNHCFVVQERAAVDKTTIPVFSDELRLEKLNVDFDPFLFSGRVDGGLVRLAASSLVNITQGGGETALVILEDF